MEDLGNTGGVRPQFSEQEYMAVIALEGNEFFKIIVDFLARRAVGTAILSTEAKEEEGHWLQGRSQELKDLHRLIRNARKNIDAMRRGRAS